MISESSTSRPMKCQRERPQAASEANTSVITTDAAVRMTLFRSHCGKWLLIAVW